MAVCQTCRGVFYADECPQCGDTLVDGAGHPDPYLSNGTDGPVPSSAAGGIDPPGQFLAPGDAIDRAAELAGDHGDDAGESLTWYGDGELPSLSPNPLGTGTLDVEFGDYTFEVDDFTIDWDADPPRIEIEGRVVDDAADDSDDEDADSDLTEPTWGVPPTHPSGPTTATQYWFTVDDDDTIEAKEPPDDPAEPDDDACEACGDAEWTRRCWSTDLEETFHYCADCADRMRGKFDDLVPY